MDSDVTHATRGVTALMQSLCNINSRTLHVASPFHSNTVPPMTIGAYVDRIARYSKCSVEAIVSAVMFMQFHAASSTHCVTVYNVHRQLITALLIAAKSRDDEYFTNTYFSRIGGISATEMQSLELLFLLALDWDTWVPEDGYQQTAALLNQLATQSQPDDGGLEAAVLSWATSLSNHCLMRRSEVSGRMQSDREEEGAKYAARHRLYQPPSPAKLLKHTPSTYQLCEDVTTPTVVEEGESHYPTEDPKSQATSAQEAPIHHAQSSATELDDSCGSSRSVDEGANTPSKKTSQQPHHTGSPTPTEEESATSRTLTRSRFQPQYTRISAAQPQHSASHQVSSDDARPTRKREKPKQWPD